MTSDPRPARLRSRRPAAVVAALMTVGVLAGAGAASAASPAPASRPAVGPSVLGHTICVETLGGSGPTHYLCVSV